MFKNNSVIRDYLLLTVGAFIMGFAIKNIYEPMNLVTGGASGVAVILKAQFEIPLWITNTALNIPLFLAGFKLKGWTFIKRTLAATAMLSLSLYVIPEFYFLTDDILLAAVFGGIISGIGTGMVLLASATTGGTDMLAALIQTYKKHYTIAQLIQVIDGVIVLVGASVFGIRYALYAVISVYALGKLSDGIIEGLKFSKAAFIISDKNSEIADAIMTRLERGVTGIQATGMYSKLNKNMLYCVVSKKEIVQIKEIVEEFDKKAFVIVTDAREVHGEGFIENR